MSLNDEVVVVYTDGSCLANGKGSAAKAGYSVFFSEGDPRNVSEPIVGDKHTNNVGELTAVVVAMEKADPNKPLLIISDSKYVILGLVGDEKTKPWHHAWQNNGWRNAKRKPVENRALWERLIAISKKRRFRIKWQKAHSGQVGNEAADRMAKSGAYRAKQKDAIKY